MNREQLYQVSLGVSVAQGGALLTLYRGIENGWALAETPVLHLPLWIIALTAPTMFLIGVTADNLRRWLAATTTWTVLVALLAVWVGWSVTPAGQVSAGGIVGIAVACWLIGSFKALMYLQIWANREPLEYAGLFKYSWRNALVTALAGLLLFGTSVVLLLWGALFDLIGIDFFEWLFQRDWFLFPFFSVVVGLGIRRFLELESVIGSIAQLLRTLIFGLLPLITLVLLLFLAAMPFTGLQPLWDTASGSTLLLALLALTTFFLNAVYQPDGPRPYQSALHRMVALGLLVLPVVGLLAIYGLYERIDQYGWTVSRSWGMTTALLLTLFAGGYLWSVVRLRDDWPTGLARTNTWGGVAVLLVVAIAQTPLLDYRAISLASQLDRLDEGALAFEEFDFRYLRRSLGRPGWLQLEAWRAEYAGDDDMLARINQTRFMPTPREAPDRIYPADHTIPPDLLATLYEGPQQLRAAGEQWLLAVDLNDDGEYEYVLFEDNTRSEDAIGYAHAVMHRDGVGQWRRHAIHGKPIPLAELEQALGDHHITVVPTEFRDLQIAGRRLRVLPEDGVTSSGNVLIQGKAYGPRQQ